MPFKNLPVPGKKVRVLCVGLREEDRSRLTVFFKGTKFDFVFVDTLHKANIKLSQKDVYPVILTEKVLPDGVWKDVEEISGNSNVVVLCRLADEKLWAEVLNSGGHDVLNSHPLHQRETCRSIVLAWEHQIHPKH